MGAALGASRVVYKGMVLPGLLVGKDRSSGNGRRKWERKRGPLRLIVVLS